MDSSELENKSNQERQDAVNMAHDLDKEFSPGRLLDQYYFHGEAAGFSGYLKRLREDPVPGALVGAAIAWSASRDQAKKAASSVADKAKGSGDGAPSQTKEKAEQAKGTAKEKTHQAKAKASETMDATKNKAHEFSDRVSDSSQKAYHRGQESIHEHPFLNMAVGFSLGAAFGGMVPMTSTEEERMGPLAERTSQAKDQAVDKARSEIDRRLH